MDDFAIQLTLILNAKPRQVWLIIVGTLLGVVLMFSFCLLLYSGVTRIQLGEMMRLAGMVPIFLGLWQLQSTFVKYQTNETQPAQTERSWRLLPTAFILYLTNSTDDIAVTTSTLVNESLVHVLLIGSGIMTGCLLSVFVARTIALRFGKNLYLMQAIAGIMLILIGFYILYR
ncbi:hypothetical protein ACFLZY_01305 [Patescibacteria group bacterium]